MRLLAVASIAVGLKMPFVAQCRPHRWSIQCQPEFVDQGVAVVVILIRIAQFEVEEQGGRSCKERTGMPGALVQFQGLSRFDFHQLHRALVQLFGASCGFSHGDPPGLCIR